MAKYIYQMVITGAQIVGRAFARALKQEIQASQNAAQSRATASGVNKESATQDLRYGLSLDEAIKILNVDKNLTKEEIESKYKHLFEVNDRSKGGSFYIQSKVRNGLNCSSYTRFYTEANIQKLSVLAGSLSSLPMCSPSLTSLRLYSTQSSSNADEPISRNEFEEAISEANIKKAFQILQTIELSKLRKRNIDFDLSKLRRAAVFVPFCRNENNQPCLLVTLRSSNLASHKWEVCFPGGKESQSDAGDTIETAIRETIEELGINRNSIQAYGALKPIIRVERNSAIYPVLGNLNLDYTQNDNPLRSFNSSEVEAVHLIPLEKVCQADNWSHTRWKSGWITPVYHDEIFNGRQVPRIWGLTSSLIFVILKIVLPQHFMGTIPPMK